MAEHIPIEHALPAVDEELARYVRQLESIFVDLRGRGVQWTPDDVGRAARWRAAGVPLSVAKRVVSARVAALRHVHGEDARVPFELRHYERALSDAMGGRAGLARLDRATASPWQHFAAAGDAAERWVDDADAPPSGPLAWAAELARTGADLTFVDPAVAHATRDAVARLDKLVLGDLAEAEIEAGVAAIRRRLRQQLARGIGPAQAAALEASVQDALEPGMSPRARKERSAALAEAWLSARFGARWPTADGWCAAAETGRFVPRES